MKPITHKLKDKINKYKKNNKDISPLIKDVDIQGEDLSNCIIRDFDRHYCNMNGTNFSGTVIGKEHTITKICDCKLRNCNFEGTRFIGTIFFRRNDCRGSNFKDVYAPNIQFQYTDLRDCKVCGAVIPWSGDDGFKAKFNKDILKQFMEGWDIKGDLDD